MANLVHTRNGVRAEARRGLALVETALVMLFLMTLFLGIIEYGWMFIKIQELRGAAHTAARVGARRGAQQTQVDTTINNLMAQANIPQFSATFPDGSADVVAEGSPYTVKVTAQFAGGSGNQGLAFMNLPFLPIPASIGGQVTMVKE